MNLKILLLGIVTLVTFAAGGIAWGQCDPDGNNTAIDAGTIDLTGDTSGWVCPSDNTDYYTFTIEPGEDLTGKITFDTPQTGTTIRIDGVATGNIYEGSTTDSEQVLDIIITSGMLPPDTYYIRISHWSVYTYDHEYTITTSVKERGCHHDGNETAETAEEIAFDREIEGWLCAEDHLDVYHFTIKSGQAGKGMIFLIPDHTILTLYVYDSSWNELFHTRQYSEEGIADYDFTSEEDGYLPNGEYYIGVLLPLDDTTEVRYTLDLSSPSSTIDLTKVMKPDKTSPHAPKPMMSAGPLHGPSMTPTKNVIGGASNFYGPYCPWPNVNCGIYNRARTDFKGPDSSGWLVYSFDVGEEGNNYIGLVVGRDDWVFCLGRPSNILYACHIPDETVGWSVQTGSIRPPALDYEGRVYYIHEDENRFIKAVGHNGAWVWSKMMPFAGKRSVELVSTRVYTATTINRGAQTYVCAWDRDNGSVIWKTDGLDGCIAGVAEDTLRDHVYVQTSQCLYQFDLDGNQNWCKRFLVSDPPSIRRGAFRPIVDSNGNVWTYYDEEQTVYVRDKDGNLLTTHFYDTDTSPRAVCLGPDDRLYMANGPVLKCYENMQDLAWEVRYTGRDGGAELTYYIRDIIIDGEGRLYAWIKRHKPSRFIEYRNEDGELVAKEELWPSVTWDYWTLVDTDDGSAGFDNSNNTRFTRESTAPVGIDPMTSGSEMAIGVDGKLILLFGPGQFRVFE